MALADGAGGGTQAGLELGARYLNARWKVVGIPVLNRKDTSLKMTAAQVNAASDFLGYKINVTPDELEIHDEYLGTGYGIPTTESLAAIRRVAQTEGIFLDPVYTSKAMSGVLVCRNRADSNRPTPSYSSTLVACPPCLPISRR